MEYNYLTFVRSGDLFCPFYLKHPLVGVRYKLFWRILHSRGLVAAVGNDADGVFVTQLCPPQHYGALCLFFSASSALWWHNSNVQAMKRARLKGGSWSSLMDSFLRRRVKWQPYLTPPAQHPWRLQ